MKVGTVSERRAAIDVAFPSWTPLTLHGALDLAEASYGNRPFLITDERCWTYSEVVTWSKRLAEGLRREAICAGDKVAIILGNYPEFVALKYAVSRIGAVAVPINTLNRRDELCYLLAQSDAAMLVTMDCFRGNDYLAALDEVAPGWEAGGGGRGALPLLRRVIVLEVGEVAPRPQALRFAHLDVEEPVDAVETLVEPTMLCDLIYTSGTTGPPKGVMLTHDMVTRTAFGAAYGRAFEDGRRIVFSLPMFHVFGYLEGMLAVSWVGGAIIPHVRFDPAATLVAIEDHRATDALLIPAMSIALIEEARARRYHLRSLKYALASGGRAPRRVWQELQDILGIEEITTGYGMTETTASSTVTRPGDSIERLLTTNGRPRDVGAAGDTGIDGRLVVYEVRDPVTGATLASPAVGELVAKGPGVTAGYYKKPEATAAAFTADGWLRTGDLGKIDSDGYISLVGRLKESYRCGGEQVLPTEVEDLLTTHPDIVQAHVVPVPDERMGEIGVAFVVARPDAELDPADLATLVAARLARFKVPRHFLIVAEHDIPTTASGRAQKFILSQKAIKMLSSRS
ncbi:MAG: AMP-binding protein [Sphingomicrobium sp.]